MKSALCPYCISKGQEEIGVYLFMAHLSSFPRDKKDEVKAIKRSYIFFTTVAAVTSTGIKIATEPIGEV